MRESQFRAYRSDVGAGQAHQATVTKLQNRSGFRLRVGDWRVIYEIQDDQVVILVLKIAPRGGVYQ